MNKLPYDETKSKEILKYAQKLIGLRFIDVLSNNIEISTGIFLEEEIASYNNQRKKGSLGNLLEEHYFFYKPNSSPEPDFYKAGVELKTTPYEKTKKGLRAGERLVISMIPNHEPIDLEFAGSHLEKKICKILMIWYHRLKGQPRIENKIDFVNLYELYSDLCEKDLEIILEDYKTIVEKVVSGNAHKLSESDTKYLGACTKGTTAKKSLQPQYYNPEIPAKRRAFSFKQSYMTYVLNSYVKPGLMSYDSIFGKEDLKEGNFDSKVLAKLDKYKGYSVENLCKIFNLPTENNSKQINKTLVNRILGVHTENSEEFEKANIVIKTIRLQKNGKPRESMSFPKVNIKDFVQQNFENSYEYEFFESTRFLFVVFKENKNGEYILAGSKFWNMPIDELETIGQNEWNAYKKKFIDGIKFSSSKQKDGKEIIKNNLPKKAETEIFHMRPHASKSAYIINGKRYGNGKDSDMDELPNGDKMTSQCFWINNDYIAKIVSDI